jgi:hypothetical protein
MVEAEVGTIRKSFEELKAKGVQVETEVLEYRCGWIALFLDLRSLMSPSEQEGRRETISQMFQCRCDGVISPPQLQSGCRPGLFIDRDQQGRALFLDEKNQKLCRLRVAGIAPDDVDVCRIFVERLSWVKGHFLAAFHLHCDLPFEHIDEGVSVVAMHGVRTARRIGHRNHGNFPIRDVR